MKTRQRARRWMAAAAALALAAGCADRKPGGGVTDPPVPGVLVATLVTPHEDDRALVVELRGPGIAEVQAAPGSGHTLHSRSADGAVRAAVFGRLQAGALLRFRVPDVGAASRYSARVLEASGADNTLRVDAGAYRLDVAPAP